ncbi:MAG: hypothetical protein ABR964_07620 [Tepidisphaeraceae bacterium]|jgi:cell division protein FtsB
MRAQKLLLVVVVLQAAVLLNQWLGAPVSTARGQIPDAGAQQQQVIDQLKDSNQKLDQLIAILQSGKLQVQVCKPDETQKQ